MYTVWRSGLVENFPTVHDIDLYQTDPMFHGHLSKKSPLIFPNFQVSAGGRDALIDRFFFGSIRLYSDFNYFLAKVWLVL